MGVKGDSFKATGTNGNLTKSDSTVDIAPKRDPKDDVRLLTSRPSTILAESNVWMNS